MEQPGPRARGPTLRISGFPCLVNKTHRAKRRGSLSHEEKRDTKRSEQNVACGWSVFLAKQFDPADSQCNVDGAAPPTVVAANALVIGVWSHRLGVDSERINPNSCEKPAAIHNALIRATWSAESWELERPRESADAGAAVFGTQPSAVDILR